MTRLECDELALLYARLVASKDSAAAAVLTALHEHVITAPIDPTTDGPLNDNDSPTNSSPDWDRPLTAAERAKRYRESRKSSRTVTQNRDASRDGRDEFRDDRDGLRDASRASEPLPLSSFQGESAEVAAVSQISEARKLRDASRHASRDGRDESDAQRDAATAAAAPADGSVTSVDVARAWNDALQQRKPGAGGHVHDLWRDEFAILASVVNRLEPPREVLAALVDWVWNAPNGVWSRVRRNLTPALVAKRVDDDIESAYATWIEKQKRAQRAKEAVG